VGRNEAENKKIKILIGRGDVLIEMKDYPGPSTLIKNYSKQDIPPAVINKAEDLTKHYSTRSRGLTKQIKFIIKKH
jgi:predicted ribosome quality control (RQC) complex YloA/Tae2 family protein